MTLLKKGGWVIPIAIGAVALAYFISKRHSIKREIIRSHVRPHIPHEVKDVYSGDWVSPYKPAFPYDADIMPPHRDPHSGRLVNPHDPFPPQPKRTAENFIINKIVHEFVAEGRLKPHMSASLHKRIAMDYMKEVERIARLNKYKQRSLHGKPLSEYSHLVLKIARNHELYLSPSARARYEAQTLYVPETHVSTSLHHVGALNMDDY